MHSIHVTDQKMHFSAAHFVIDGGGCERLHGHNYTVELFISGPLNEKGMVIDFRRAKQQVIRICKTLDHLVLLPGESSEIKPRDLDDAIEIRIEKKRYVFPKEDCAILPVRATTAELLAEYFAKQLKFEENLLIKVCVSESPGSTGCFDKQ